MKAVVAAFNQEKALVGAFSVITNLRMELFEALLSAVLVSRKSLLILIRSQINDSLKCAQTLDNKPDAESFKRSVIYGWFGQGKKEQELKTPRQ